MSCGFAGRVQGGRSVGNELRRHQRGMISTLAVYIRCFLSVTVSLFIIITLLYAHLGLVFEIGGKDNTTGGAGSVRRRGLAGREQGRQQRGAAPQSWDLKKLKAW